MAVATEDIYSWRRRAAHLGPFAGTVVLGYILAALPPHIPHADPWLIAGGACFAAVGLLVVVVPWHRLPEGSVFFPVLLFCVAVALLRHANGGGHAGVEPLLLLPVIWQASYGRRFELVGTVIAVGATFVVPMVFVGAPNYPANQWRLAVFATATAATAGFVVESLTRTREQLPQQLQGLAGHDELTGLSNRRRMNEVIAEQLERLPEDGETALAVVDLDHFKRFNDEYGHVAGDRLLSDAAEAWGSVLRRRDVLSRWGGEEFVVLFPDTRTDEARVVLQRMAEVTPAGLTFSAGLIAAAGKQTVDDALRAADEVLYRAKAQGRNRILCV